MKITLTSNVTDIKFLDDAFWKDLTEKLVEVEVDKIEGLFTSTTATWDSKPKFNKRTRSLAHDIASGQVWTTDKPFVWVNDGTKKRYMRMAPGYSPKSQPNKLGTHGAGGARRGLDVGDRGSGAGPRARARRIRARNFDEIIARLRNKSSNKDSFQRNVRDAYTAALKQMVTGKRGLGRVTVSSVITRGKGKVTWP